MHRFVRLTGAAAVLAIGACTTTQKDRGTGGERFDAVAAGACTTTQPDGGMVVLYVYASGWADRWLEMPKGNEVRVLGSGDPTAPGDFYDLFAQVKKTGDRVVEVRFRCGPRGDYGRPIQIRPWDSPVDTGCKTAAGKPIRAHAVSVGG